MKFDKLQQETGCEVEVNNGSVTIQTSLHEFCPVCSRRGCYDCQDQDDSLDDREDRKHYNYAMDGIESLLMALAGQGVNLDDENIIAAVKTAIEGVAQNTC